MKKKAFQMSALNDKQMWLCDIMTRLRLIKYTERDEADIVAHVLESPITGKPINVWWYVESLFIVHKVFTSIWNSRICFDKEAERHMDELIKLGWITFDPKEEP